MALIKCLKWLCALSLLCLTIVLPSCKKEEDPEPAPTDENLYINEIYASGDDWIELFNNTNASKDLSGYKIYDDAANKYTLPAGTVIPANGFLTIYCDDLATGLHTNFKLTSSGETIYLENTSTLIDKVTYPLLDNGQSYGRYPDGSTTFAVSGSVSQGASNGNNNAPAIANVTRTPLVVSITDNVSVKANFVSMTGIASVKLYYRANNTGPFTAVDMTAGQDGYTAEIPSLGNEGRIDYYVEAKNSAGDTARNPNSAPDKTHFYIMTTDALPLLVINEYMAVNASSHADIDGGVEEFDDWIEIHNKGAQPIDVGGMYLSDDNANPFNYRIPDTDPALTTIPAGGYLLIWADNDTDQGVLHLDFGLSTDGEELGLYYIDGRAIDQFSFPAQTTDVSMARKPNGTGAFSADPSPTPKAVNN